MSSSSYSSQIATVTSPHATVSRSTSGGKNAVKAMHRHLSTTASHIPLLTSSLSSPVGFIGGYSNWVPSPRTCGAIFNQSGNKQFDNYSDTIYY